jgi:hypothetical protein
MLFSPFVKRKEKGYSTRRELPLKISTKIEILNTLFREAAVWDFIPLETPSDSNETVEKHHIPSLTRRGTSAIFLFD